MGLKRQALFWGSFFLLIVGFILHVHQLFAMAATLACLPFIAWLLGRRKLAALTVIRKAPPAAVVGERVAVDLEVTNTARTRRIFFVVSDQLPTALQATGSADLPVAILGAGERLTVSYEVQPPRRGAYPLGPIQLKSPDAIGLRQYQHQLDERSELLVYPQRLDLPYLWPTAEGGRRLLQPRRRVKGQGDELYGIRDYVPGDDPRHIDWKTSARRSKLAVVEYERPEALEGMILLDVQQGWHAGNDDPAGCFAANPPRHTLEYGVTLAASLIEQAYERGSFVGLITSGAPDFAYAPASELEQRQRLFEALARVQVDGVLPLASALASHQDLLPPHASVAVISPSPEAGPVAAFLRGLGHPVSWFLLDANTFQSPRRVNYEPLLQTLAAARCKVHIMRGDRPLAANWLQSGGKVSHATG